MARLTAQQWDEIKKAWEADLDASAADIVKKLGLTVSVQSVNKRVRSEGWAKGGSGPRPKKGSKSARTKVSGVLKVSKASKSRRKLSEESEENQETAKEKGGAKVSGKGVQAGSKDELTPQKEIFIREYMLDWNATRAAIRAGFSAKSAGQIGWKLLQQPKVSARIQELAAARVKRLDIKADDLTRMWAGMLEADVNEFVSLELTCCRYCYGKNHEFQHSPWTLKIAKESHEKRRLQQVKAGMDDPGPFPPYEDEWYDPTKPPNPECPNCHGRGEVQRVLKDTRQLSPAARALFMGVEQFQGDLNVKLINKEKIHEWLAKAVGVWKEKEQEIETKSAIPEMLDAAFNRVMEESRRRTAAMYERRGLLEDIEDAEVIEEKKH